MKQQLEQLLKDAEEVTAKMREALASMETPAINMEHGKWYRCDSGHYWLIKFDRIEDYKVMVLDSFCISTDSNYGGGYHCDVNDIKSCSPATPEDMQLLPDGHPEKPWMPKKGDWAEVIDGTFCFKTGDVIQIDEDGSLIPLCISQNGERRAISSHKLRHLPDYKPKPALAATYEEVVDNVLPKWICDSDGEIIESSIADLHQLPTEAAAKQDRAYIQIKNLEAYCAEKFPGERDHIIDIYSNGELCPMECTYGIIKVTEQAAKWLIKTHPEPFLVFFGVKS